MSTGWSYCLRKVDCQNKSNGACGTNDGFHGGNPLRMVDRLNNVDWHGVWEWVEMGWWMQWVKMTVGVAAAVPCGSCGGVGSRGVMWWLRTVVAMVAVAERAPQVSVV